MRTSPVTCVSYHHFERTSSPLTRHLRVATTPDTFARHLTYFRRCYTPISIDRLISGDIPPRALLITIDDAYRSVLEIAAPMLRDAGMPAVLMTNARVVEGGCVPLDNVLSLAMEELGPTGLGTALALTDPWSCTIQRLVQDHLPRLNGERREEMRQRLLRLLRLTDADILASSQPFLSADDLHQLAARYDIAVGNHTLSHVHLRALDSAELVREIAGGRAAVEQITRRPARAFSIPYGSRKDATPAALEVIRASGHEAVFLVQTRTNAARPAPDIWFRQSMSEDPVLHLAIKLDLLPRMGELKAALN